MFATLDVDGKKYKYCPIADVEGVEKLPFSLRVLLENVMRCARSGEEAAAMAAKIVDACRSQSVGGEVEFAPSRVLFQDFTGVPVFVDFAVMREACEQLGGDPSKINPQVPCDLVVDHSVIADCAGAPECLERNAQLEHARNSERYEFLKWAQASFENVRIVPPGQGICHQLNIEQFASVVMTRDAAADSFAPGSCPESGEPREGDACEVPLAYFDTLVGTDSHTPTANGLGVLGWGVGGIEAEAAALGQPITILVPKVVGVNMVGSLAFGATAMDVALTLAEKLRQVGVVGCFVECFGEGVSSLSATQRATISNMTPEYGCTCTLFPVDGRTLDLLRLTGRSEEQVRLVERYAKEQGLFYGDGVQGTAFSAADSERIYSRVIELDLSAVKSSMAGPSRPHDRLVPSQLPGRFAEGCNAHGASEGAFAEVEVAGVRHRVENGAIAIAAITSCTTATDPAMMLQAGLVARNARRAGLSPKPWVKTILAPGSHSTEMLLQKAGLLDSLEQMGFYTCGFGCMSCIGNSGPLSPQMHEAAGSLELASVLSGNRNFEGRISPDVSQNYLMSPAYVVLMSIAGTVDFNLEDDALGYDMDGNAVYAADLIPDADELNALFDEFVSSDIYSAFAETMFDGDAIWSALSADPSSTFAWDPKSTYVRRPTYFDGMTKDVEAASQIEGAMVLAKLGDFITTDHISPAGAMSGDMPAAGYLEDAGVAAKDFNTYGSRRGNHEVMMRGTFGNVKLSNELADGKSGGYTHDMLSDEPATIFDAAMHYMSEGVPSIVIAGKMYGSGSSRDWAAKGPALLGVKAVIAESFERIHRSNLIGMGILPLQFAEGQSADSLELDGTESYSILWNAASGSDVAHVVAQGGCGRKVEFEAVVRIDTPTELEYYENGGILQYVLRGIASSGHAAG